MKPFRVKYLDYIKSEAIDTDNGRIYHVFFTENEDSPEIGWREKFMQRDFGIGANVGALCSAVVLAAGGLAVAPLSICLVGVGAAIGGISDYVRNEDEMQKGAFIKPASYINRDTILGTLSTSTNFGLAATIGMMAAGAVSLSIAAPVAVAISVAAFGSGAIYGGIEGAKDGYKFMNSEYMAAKAKHENPDYKVTLSQKRETHLDDVISNEAAIAATILPMMVKGLAKTDSNLPLNLLQTSQISHQPPKINLKTEKELV